MKIKYYVIVIITMLLPLNFASAFDGLLFKPLAANVFEPRVGAMYQLSADKLRLDIGTSIDLAELIKNPDNEVRLGVDFFTYTRLRSEGRFKFPVETSDYFFGVYTTATAKLFDLDFSSRLRLAHISSHLVDGYSNDGIFNKKPFVYSREFFDLVIVLESKKFRPYVGASIVFSTIPDNVNLLIPELGFDFLQQFSNWLEFRAGYDFKLTGSDNIYLPVHSFQAGLLLKTEYDVGISLNYYFYSGNSIHGMFYNEKDEYSGIGFQIYFY